MAGQAKKKRNFKREYRKRIRAGKAKGKSRAASRGHPRAVDLGGTASSRHVDRKDPLEVALSLMKKGSSQKAAAKHAGVSVERLRRYQHLNTTSHRVGRAWAITDSRPVEVLLATRGELQFVTVSRDAASDVGTYWAYVNKFLETNKVSHLAGFVGKGIRDVEGKLHPYETRPNVLRKLDSAGELHFIDIYRQTVPQ